MKYETSIIINAPLETVVQKFDNPQYYEKWMDGLKSFEVINGKFGKEGTVSKFHFQMGKREISMLETVLVANLPEQYKVKYEADNVLNYVDNKMLAVDENTTQYIVEHEFIFSGFMKLMGWLMPAAFKKQSKKYLLDFKSFVESNDK